MEKYILNTLSLETHFIFSYLNKYIVIVVFSSIDENSKQGQDRVLDKEQTLRPHHHKSHHRQYHATHPHHPEVHLASPVPLWNNKKFILLHDYRISTLIWLMIVREKNPLFIIQLSLINDCWYTNLNSIKKHLSINKLQRSECTQH